MGLFWMRCLDEGQVCAETERLVAEVVLSYRHVYCWLVPWLFHLDRSSPFVHAGEHAGEHRSILRASFHHGTLQERAALTADDVL